MPQYELNLRDYLRIFHKRKFTIIITFLLVTIGSAFLSTQPPLIYKASTTVKIEERKTIAGLLTEWIISSPGNVMESQTRIIRGFPIMKKVALRLRIINDKTPTPEIHKVVNNLQNSIETERIERTNIIRITASASSAKEARDLAEAAASVYVEENLLEKTRQARSARRFIEEQLSILGSRLEKAEDRLSKFEEKMDKADEIKKVNETDEVMNMRLLEPIQKKLVDLKFELVALLQRYTDKHPRIVRLKKEIKNLETKHEKQVKDLEAKQEKQIKDLKAQQEKQSKDLEARRKSLSEQKLEYGRLAREVEVNKKLFMMFKEKLEEARITEAQKVGDISIVDPAVMPASPIDTQGKMNVFIGGIMGLLLGIALAFVFEALDTSLGTIEDIENVVKLPVLGVVPSARSELNKKEVKYREKISHISRKKAEEAYMRLIVHHQPKSSVAEACRNIRTNLKLGPSKKTILLTSAGPEEGKTTLMTNLGLAVAQTGAKTLLVSSDLRRPVIARTFGTKKKPGLTELISGSVSLEDALRNISDFILGDMGLDEITKKPPGIENIWILPSGDLPVNPAEILESKMWTDLMEELKERFDIIFFDSPPVLPVTDASLLASRVDSVVLCYEIGRISRNALLRAKIQLESVGADISGVVLNQINLKTRAVAPYAYYQTYKYGYEDKPGKKQEAGTEPEEV
ncbi:MAG TPA: polysaccharide biosynthesis tyrosine autokinase [Nitrospirae bacterium]|nr:tyrosine-protein kinase wzc [bacterium BMS3Abin06]HDH13551.1 polysaccharide biosynthesis tyrosine autokinase [Nitrospirota bacterium]HDZ01009.1 polysaccharide biosynthesis tyrosine autokinase [Nitrospirota bacterium]